MTSPMMGDPKYVVRQRCGEPTAKQEMGATWVYDFGPQRFVYYIKFNDGAVFRILTGGYGTLTDERFEGLRNITAAAGTMRLNGKKHQ